MFETGVARYVKGTAQVVNFFPVDLKGNADVSCKHCRFYMQSRFKCGLNGEVCDYPEKYIGARCPLNFEEGTEE